MALTVQQTWRHRRERLVKLLGVTESKDNAVDALAIAIERAVLKKSANSGPVNTCIIQSQFLTSFIEQI
jgi:hypothetical protein